MEEGVKGYGNRVWQGGHDGQQPLSEHQVVMRELGETWCAGLLHWLLERTRGCGRGPLTHRLPLRALPSLTHAHMHDRWNVSTTWCGCKKQWQAVTADLKPASSANDSTGLLVSTEWMNGWIQGTLLRGQICAAYACMCSWTWLWQGRFMSFFLFWLLQKCWFSAGILRFIFLFFGKAPYSFT